MARDRSIVGTPISILATFAKTGGQKIFNTTITGYTDVTPPQNPRKYYVGTTCVQFNNEAGLFKEASIDIPIAARILEKEVQIHYDNHCKYHVNELMEPLDLTPNTLEELRLKYEALQETYDQHLAKSKAEQEQKKIEAEKKANSPGFLTRLRRELNI